jgi:tape measure domain-containing protein
MAEIKSIYAPQVEADLKKVFSELEKHHKLIIEMSKTSIDLYGGRQAGNPAELKNAIKAYEELAQKQKQLTEAKRQSNTRTSEEIVNQRVLAQNADRQTKANSALVGAYARLNAQHQIAMQRVRDLTVSYGSQHRATVQAQKDFDVLDKKIKQADNAVRVHNRNVGNYKSALGGLSNLMGAFGIAGGLTLFAQMTMDTVRLIKELQSLNLALKQVSGTEADFTSNLSFIQETSENLGLSVNDLTRQFTQFYVSAKDKMSRTDLEQVFTSIAKAGATMGLSLDMQNRAFVALNQIMAKGQVMSEELKGQLAEALPGALSIMARSLNVTEKELMKMMQAGEVSSDALVGFAKELERTYGIENITNVKTLTAETNRLSNAWTNFVASVDKGDGIISKSLNFILREITEAIKGWDKINKGTSEFQKGLRQELRQTTKEQTILNLEKYKEENLIKSTGDLWKKDAVERIAIHKQEMQFYVEQNAIAVKNRDGLKRNTVGWVMLNDRIKENNETIRAYKSEIEKDRGIIEGVNSVIAEKIKKTKESSDETEKDTKATTKNTKAKEKQRELIVGSIEWLEAEISKLKEIQKQTSTTSEEYNLFNTELQTLIGTLEMLTKAREKLTAVEAKPLGRDSGNELEERLKAETEAFIAQNQAKEKAIELMKELADQMLNTYGSDFINNSGLTNFFDIAENGLGQFGDNWQAKTVAIMEATQEMFNFIANLSQAHFAQEYSDLERQKEISIQFAGDSTEAREEIEQEYERRRKEIQIREAKAKRSQAIFNIGIDMAQAIMRAWAQNPITAPVFTAIIGALGVAQIAAVASQPLPQFWKGTDNSPEGFAEVGERGRELIKDGKSGQWRLADKKGVDYLTKGSTVLTNANTEKVLNFHAFNKGLTNTLVENNIDFYPIESKIDKLTNAILNKESLRIVDDSNGRRYYEEKNGQMKSLNNARLEIKQRVF